MRSVLCTRRNASLVFGVENGPVLNFGLDSDLGLRIFCQDVAAVL